MKPIGDYISKILKDTQRKLAQHYEINTRQKLSGAADALPGTLRNLKGSITAQQESKKEETRMI